MLNKAVRDDNLAGTYYMFLLLLLAIFAASRITTNSTGWRAEVEDTADLSRSAAEIEGPIMLLNDISKEDSNHERFAAERESGNMESVMNGQQAIEDGLRFVADIDNVVIVVPCLRDFCWSNRH